MSAALSSLYNTHPLILWVEDEETRAYLDACWQDNDIGFRIAGGCSNMHSLVADARKAGHTHVFALRDRDFGSTNYPSWADLTKPISVFAGETFEVENYLLDPAAIAQSQFNTRSANEVAVTAELQALGNVMTWWMACRREIHAIHEGLIRDFMEHPGKNQVSDFLSAMRAIDKSVWWTRTAPNIRSKVISQHQVKINLRRHEKEYATMVGNQEWRRRFSGKEVCKPLINWVWTRKPPGPVQMVRDFAQDIGSIQRTSTSVPVELRELRSTLRTRVGLPPPP